MLETNGYNLVQGHDCLLIIRERPTVQCVLGSDKCFSGTKTQVFSTHNAVNQHK